MLRRATAAVLATALLLAGCASVRSAVPAYPPPGKTLPEVAADKTDCEQWAKQESRADVAGSAITGGLVGAGVGAAVGAALGAVVGAFFHDVGGTAAFGAAVGGMTGGMQGAAGGGVSARHLEENAYGTCMLGKGYAVKW